MYQPENNQHNVHYLHGAASQTPQNDDVMRTLLRELSDAQPLESGDRLRDNMDRDEPAMLQVAGRQHVEGQGNIQISVHDVAGQTVHGNNNIQIAAIQLVVQLGKDTPSPPMLSRCVLYIVVLGLLGIVFFD